MKKAPPAHKNMILEWKTVEDIDTDPDTGWHHIEQKDGD
jgi:hypothetical protein